VKTCTPAVLAGDFNIIPTELDAYKPERWVDDALFRPESRAAFEALLDQGWRDALRSLHPAERIFTFWDYFRNAFPRDAGLRIDQRSRQSGPELLIRVQNQDIAIQQESFRSNGFEIWSATAATNYSHGSYAGCHVRAI
jgi:exodeoxyribonuclease-3